MLTRKRWTAPNYTGNPATDYANLTKSISDYLLSLEAKGSLAIEAANITATNGIIFPSGTMDDFKDTTTWTPGVSFGGGTTGITYTTQTGSYFKLGDWYFFNGFVELSNKGSSTGDAVITGLPAAIRNNNDSYGSLHIYLFGVTFANQHQARLVPGGTTISLNEVTEAGTPTTLTDANFSNTSGAIFSGFYRAT